jgi:CHAT domain-containing protein
VPDAQTVELMDNFYSNWNKGQSVEDAFYNAQKVLRDKYDPYYWAAFVLVK